MRSSLPDAFRTRVLPRWSSSEVATEGAGRGASAIATTYKLRRTLGSHNSHADSDLLPVQKGAPVSDNFEKAPLMLAWAVWHSQIKP